MQSEMAVIGWELPQTCPLNRGKYFCWCSQEKVRERLDVERCVELGTVLGCARLYGRALAWALGIVLALLSFRESSTIDGDST